MIRYADAVVTDSFHGSAFSIIYQKQFYAIKRMVNNNDVYDHDCRIRNILEILNINNYFSNDEEIDFESSYIDYISTNKKLMLERKKSLRYLKNALNILEEKNEARN